MKRAAYLFAVAAAACDSGAGRVDLAFRFAGDARGRVIARDHRSMWEWIADPEDRPAVLATIDAGAARIARRDLISGLSVRARASGDGYTVDLSGFGDFEGGAELLAWDGAAGGRTSIAASTTQVATELSGVLSRRAISGADQKISLAIRSRVGRGNGPAPARVEVEELQVAIDYRALPF